MQWAGWRRSIAATCLVTTAVLVLVAVGIVTATSPLFGLAAATALVLVGMTAVEPLTLPVLAIPAMAIVLRVGGESQGLSVSDLVLVAALAPALAFVRHPYDPALRKIIWLVAVYQASTLFTVVMNPYRANAVEWVHAAVLVAGAAIVGWAVGVSGRARLALTALMLVCAVFAVLTIAEGLAALAAGSAEPVYLDYPYGMHKNFVGCLLGFTAVIAYANPVWLGWSRRAATSGVILFVGAVVASQSRQAIIGLAVCIALIALRPGQGRRHSLLVPLAMIPPVVFAASVVQDQLDSGNQFNSVYQRLAWYEQAVDLWQQQPWFGAGLRWWYTERFAISFQPPNVILEMLTTAGLVGLIGFLVMIGGSIVVLWRIDARYGTVAAALVLERFIQGQFDLYWTAVHVSVPFAVAGICIGAMVHDRADETGAPQPGQRNLNRVSS